MKILGKYWKVLLALILVGAAAWMYFNVYETEKTAYENQTQQLKSMITALEARIQENMKYADVQDKLEDATAQVMASRLDLYKHFPVEMKQEDQIMYVLYLETIFGTEIQFAFSESQPMMALSDGAALKGLTLTVNYETTYKGFQDMITYLATDSRVTSVQFADIMYDAVNDKAVGTITLLLYLVESDLLEYLPPEMFQPETGKDNIYD